MKQSNILLNRTPLYLQMFIENSILILSESEFMTLNDFIQS